MGRLYASRRDCLDPFECEDKKWWDMDSGESFLGFAMVLLSITLPPSLLLSLFVSHQGHIFASSILNTKAVKKYVKNVTLIRFYTVSALGQLNPTLSNSDTEEQTVKTHDQNHLTTSHSLELDRVKVAEALNSLRKEPLAAFSLFKELKQEGCSHDVYAYAAIVRILCCWGMGRKLDSVLLELIRKERGLDFEIVDFFRALGEGVESESCNVLARVSDALVKVYAKVEMFDEAIDVLFQNNKGCGFVPQILSCNFLMNRLIECRRVDMAVAIYRHLKSIDLSPNDYTYTLAIKAFCVRGSLEEAVDVFCEMQEAGVTPNAFAYTTYIEGLCKHQGSDSGFKMLQALISAKVPIDVFAYTAVIRGFCKEMKLQEAESVLLDMENQGFVPDVYIYGALIWGFSKARDLHKMLSLHDEMESKGIKTNCVILSSILQGLLCMGGASEVVSQFDRFKEMGIKLDKACYNIVMNALCKLGEMDRAVALLIDMKVGAFSRNGLVQKAFKLLNDMDTWGLKPNMATHNKTIEGFCIGGKVEDAEAFFDNLEEKCLENYSTMVNGYCKANHTDEAFQLFARLSKQGFVVNNDSCLKLLCNLCKKDDYKKSLFLFSTMLAMDVSPGEIMYSKVIGLLCHAGEMGKAQRVFDVAITRGINPDLFTYTSMINSYCKANRLREAWDLLNDMKKRGIEPDVVTYTVLIDGCSKIKDILAFWREMKDMDVEPDVICYTVLIDKHCKMNNIQDATSLFKEIIARGLKPDTVTYTSLLSGYCKTNDIQVATSLFKQINDSGLEPDSVTYTALLSGYCSIGDIDRGTALVNEMKDKRIQLDGHAKAVIHHLNASKLKFQHEGGIFHHQLDHLFSGFCLGFGCDCYRFTIRFWDILMIEKLKQGEVERGGMAEFCWCDRAHEAWGDEFILFAIYFQVNEEVVNSVCVTMDHMVELHVFDVYWKAQLGGAAQPLSYVPWLFRNIIVNTSGVDINMNDLLLKPLKLCRI
ncbi:unnamed protein product [Dovyalis caffra]|uniref:Pentatricopeptide repeat-containing protein n=1 Tax=Dovyalis caffra TaxID=77055 RepID=A0AAV1QWP5_9ROSI|nr:unnamed protein product [Dovyalis caffra]